MPSPIAHASIALIADSAIGDRPRAEALWRRAAFGLAVVFACGAPDLDIIAGWVLIGDGFTHHGAYSHSFACAVIFGLVFAPIFRWLRPTIRIGRAIVLGWGLYAAHIVMDTLIYDTRGVGLLWPLLPDRFASPIVLFVGVEYGQWWRWDLHLLTVLNEGAFAVLVLWLSKAATAARRRKAGPTHAER
ncbi:MAG: metal-dependent hydrolase [Planctomycetota bacterium]